RSQRLGLVSSSSPSLEPNTQPQREQRVTDETDMAKNVERTDPTKELRLGVVCYGGSSLAIYMHGVTKELNRLVKASALLDADLEPQKWARSEAFYVELLRRLAQDSGVRTRVVVDVVAGTSAAGINGINMTTALAHNLTT